MPLLYETAELCLRHQYECARLTDRASGAILFEADFYGDPTCGLIAPDNTWAVVGGERLIVWVEHAVHVVEDISWVFDVRQTAEQIIEVLVDPWHDDSAIWRVDIVTRRASKLRGFPDYRFREYTDDVVW